MTDTTTLTPPTGDTPEPPAPTKPFAWKPFAIIAAILVVVVIVAMLVSGGGKTKGLDGTWRDTDTGDVWTFAKGSIHATHQDESCDGTYTAAGALTNVTLKCIDSTAKLATSGDKNVAAIGGDSALCLVREGSGDAKLDTAAISAQCTQLLKVADPDRGTRSDLRNALTAEKTVYDDNQAYDATVTNMKAVEPSLDWGGKLKIVVGDAADAGDAGTVCLSETGPSGHVLELADVSAGDNAGTYYGTSPAGCPANDGSGANLKALGSSW